MAHHQCLSKWMHVPVGACPRWFMSKWALVQVVTRCYNDGWCLSWWVQRLSKWMQYLSKWMHVPVGACPRGCMPNWALVQMVTRSYNDG